ncbi:MAG TPA: endonuclease [Dehalococcoidia bacterium]|nr:endonuclease [Dehalococcoidia bacterium]
MSILTKMLDERPAIRAILLPALVVLFGAESVRYFVSGMTWALGDRFSVGAFQLGGIAIVVFGMAFMAVLLRHAFGTRISVVFAALVLGMMRLLAQIQYGEPIVNMVMVAFGIAFFGMFLAVYLDNARSGGRQALSYLAIGLLTGFIMDTALNGLFGSYDHIYQGGIVPLIVAIVLFLIELLLLPGYNISMNEKPSNNSILPWLAIAPFFFLEMEVFGNIARFTALTGWMLPLAFTIVLCGQLLGLLLATKLLSLGEGLFKTTILISSMILLIATLFADSGSVYLIAIMTILGQVSLMVLIVGVINNIGGNINGKASRTSTVVNGFAMILFAVMVLAYYAVYQISLPYSGDVLEIMAAVLLILCAVIPLRSYVSAPGLKTSLYVAPVISLVLLVAPAVSFISWHEPEAINAGSDNIKVMSYNLHNGFDTRGELGLEALAAVIEENGADIVALQEISRGWLVSGSVDMLSWLSQRLDMPYVSGSTAGPLWGNAILSKYPIKGYETFDLPPDDLCIQRGFIAVKIDTGDMDLQIIATHLHHVEEDSDIRQVQVPVILEYWDNTPNTIILGDLNAQPDAPEIMMLYQAGLVDTMAEHPEALTYHSADLYQRIDYIWLSPDIQLVESHVVFSQASDHLAVIAVIGGK